MKVSLWSDGALLGNAELLDVLDIPLQAPAMSGSFLPTARFAAVWPILQNWNRRGAELVAVAQRLAPGLSPEGFREQLLAGVPGTVTAALHESEHAVAVLGLELRDNAGNVIPTTSIQIHECHLFSAITESQERVAHLRAEATRQGIPTHGHVMVVTGTGPTHPSVIPPAI